MFFSRNNTSKSQAEQAGYTSKSADFKQGGEQQEGKKGDEQGGASRVNAQDRTSSGKRAGEN